MRLGRWWLNLNFSLNYPFKTEGHKSILEKKRPAQMSQSESKTDTDSLQGLIKNAVEYFGI